MSAPRRRVRIQWTETAKNHLKGLPLDARKGLLKQADQLTTCTDIKNSYKPLMGPLAGCYRLRFSRYRAVFRVDEDELANGDTLINIRVIFLTVGKRQERSKGDVYRVAKRLVEKGLIDLPDDED